MLFCLDTRVVVFLFAMPRSNQRVSVLRWLGKTDVAFSVMLCKRLLLFMDGMGSCSNDTRASSARIHDSRTQRIDFSLTRAV